jgi:hypothetical protein
MRRAPREGGEQAAIRVTGQGWLFSLYIFFYTKEREVHSKTLTGTLGMAQSVSDWYGCMAQWMAGTVKQSISSISPHDKAKIIN